MSAPPCVAVEALRREIDGRMKASDARVDRVVLRMERTDDHLQALERLVMETRTGQLKMAEDLGAVRGMLSIMAPRIEALADSLDREGDRLSAVENIMESAEAPAKAPGKWSWLPAAAEAAAKGGRFGYVILGAALMLAVLVPLLPYLAPVISLLPH
jgi:VIT1/CCC1 family predicted Fe2+/Mn2+ transporter